MEDARILSLISLTVITLLLLVIGYIYQKYTAAVLENKMFGKRLDIIRVHEELGKFTEFVFNEFFLEQFMERKALDSFKFKDEEVKELTIEIVSKTYKLLPPVIFETYIRYLNISEDEFQEILIMRVRTLVVSLFLKAKR